MAKFAPIAGEMRCAVEPSSTNGLRWYTCDSGVINA
jgi:hypothetical protein